MKVAVCAVGLLIDHAGDRAIGELMFRVRSPGNISLANVAAQVVAAQGWMQSSHTVIFREENENNNSH